ncbi:MAG: hypothetical protein K0R00_115 [Herbinix sp.]|jgi:hypothetical protein|nr:hypothetical protein [Herbinix sp.]
MDKVAYYEDIIYKEAMQKSAMARAWKKVVGGLSDKSVNRLMSSGVLNHEKELAGLNKGTENILKSKGAKSVSGFTPDDMADRAISSVKSRKFFMDQIKSVGGDPEDYRQDLKDAFEAGGGFQSMLGAHGGGFAHKGDINKLTKTLKGMGADLKSFENPTDRKFTEAIINRHEANEINHGSNLLKSKRSSIAYKDQRVPMADTSSHISPKVILNESADTAIAPKATKEYMKKMRGVTGELDGYKELGLNYGESGVYNKNLGNKLQRSVVKENRPIFKDTINELNKTDK